MASWEVQISLIFSFLEPSIPGAQVGNVNGPRIPDALTGEAYYMHSAPRDAFEGPRSRPPSPRLPQACAGARLAGACPLNALQGRQVHLPQPLLPASPCSTHLAHSQPFLSRPHKARLSWAGVTGLPVRILTLHQDAQSLWVEWDRGRGQEDVPDVITA